MSRATGTAGLIKTSIQLPPELLERLDQTCAQRNVSRSVVVIEALKNELPDGDAEEAARDVA